MVCSWLPFFFISGRELPVELISAATVEHEDSFIIIGGGYGNSRSNKIYKHKDGDQWVEVSTTLTQGKADLTAIKVKSSLFNC